MSSVYVIQSQAGQFLSRRKEWLDKTEINALYKTPHRDLAINELVEITSKHTDVRAKVVEAGTSSKGLPLVADLPPLEFPKIALPDDIAAMEPTEETSATVDPAPNPPPLSPEPGDEENPASTTAKDLSLSEES